MAANTDIDALVECLYQAANQSDEARCKARDALQNLQLRLETPHDAYNRFAYMHLEITFARIAEDLQIYQILVESGQPVSVAGLSAKTGAALLFTRRVLRYLASVGQIQETGKDEFAANELTKILAEPGYRGTIYHTFENVGPALQVLPSFFAETKYQDINDAAKTAAQRAFQTDLPMFSWLPTQPERFEPLQQTMSAQPKAAVPWFSAFPFEKELGEFAGPHALVDVGGGFGHQCIALLSAFPQLRERLVVQDLPQTLEHMSPLDGVQATSHDFFKEQPIKGARFYYLRNILHDWPDEKAIAILSHLKDALAPGSQILIDEIIMPNVNAHWHSTSLDMIMMSCLGSRERTVDDWHSLLDAAGLQAVRISTYMPRRADSIIQVIPK
ncbi:Demethylsterigmatocystin 6-O-methyltransferase [Cladobotryum mycophilum]|uniref:Demethylsterigmatocystin 6-O-methyltransferase n=1 Tax=Cladobotryum mycophilum TaxID=491253 RepID=A0ABR0SQS3_9HYPO